MQEGNNRKCTCCPCKDKISCLTVLNIMIWFGFFINYMLRVNLSLGIVAMTYQSKDDLGPKYHWNTWQQNQVTACFSYGYLLTEIPGGFLADLFGGKPVFGFSMLLCSIVTLLSPLAASFGYIYLGVIRVIVGLSLGFTWPSVHPLAAKWVPPNKRSKFMSNILASSFGAGFTSVFGGVLIDWFHWPSIFYITGGIGIFYCLMWYYLIYESPATHPRISEAEKDSLLEATKDTHHKHVKVPCLKLLLSIRVWAICLAHTGSIFGYFTMIFQLPTYMKNVLGFNIKKNGLLSSLPYFGRYFMSLFTCILADWLRSTKRFTPTTLRKAFTFYAVCIPGIFIAILTFVGNEEVPAVIIFTLTLTFNGAVAAGYLGNGLDIAPNFSGLIFGLASFVATAVTISSPFMIAAFTATENTFQQWRKAFAVVAGMYFFGGLAFLCLGSGELQSWNTPKEET